MEKGERKLKKKEFTIHSSLLVVENIMLNISINHKYYSTQFSKTVDDGDQYNRSKLCYKIMI